MSRTIATPPAALARLKRSWAGPNSPHASICLSSSTGDDLCSSTGMCISTIPKYMGPPWWQHPVPDDGRACARAHSSPASTAP